MPHQLFLKVCNFTLYHDEAMGSTRLGILTLGRMPEFRGAREVSNARPDLPYAEAEFSRRPLI